MSNTRLALVLAAGLLAACQGTPPVTAPTQATATAKPPVVAPKPNGAAPIIGTNEGGGKPDTVAPPATWAAATAVKLAMTEQIGFACGEAPCPKQYSSRGFAFGSGLEDDPKAEQADDAPARGDLYFTAETLDEPTNVLLVGIGGVYALSTAKQPGDAIPKALFTTAVKNVRVIVGDVVAFRHDPDTYGIMKIFAISTSKVELAYAYPVPAPI